MVMEYDDDKNVPVLLIVNYRSSEGWLLLQEEKAKH